MAAAPDDIAALKAALAAAERERDEAVADAARAKAAASGAEALIAQSSGVPHQCRSIVVVREL